MPLQRTLSLLISSPRIWNPPSFRRYKSELPCISFTLCNEAWVRMVVVVRDYVGSVLFVATSEFVLIGPNFFEFDDPQIIIYRLQMLPFFSMILIVFYKMQCVLIGLSIILVGILRENSYVVHHLTRLVSFGVEQ